MQLLTALFSYNRYYLLKNTIDSWIEFGPGGDLLIIDDGSDDLRLVSYLKELTNRNRITVIQRNQNHLNVHGGLYANMTLATQYAIDHAYEYIFFLQDDVQFMWRDEQFLDRIRTIFATCTDAAMITPFFHRAIMARQMRKRLIPHASGLCWHLLPYGIIDIGIMPVQLLKEKKYIFRNSETENSFAWKAWGYKLYSMPAPILAFIPWPEVRSSGRKMGFERLPKRKYFLKPLNEERIAKLKNQGLSIADHEDYCLPWGWSCLSPYWFTKFSNEYWKYLWKSIRHNERWPKWIRG